MAGHERAESCRCVLRRDCAEETTGLKTKIGLYARKPRSVDSGGGDVGDHDEKMERAGENPWGFIVSKVTW